jgi:hypothetical protein
METCLTKFNTFNVLPKFNVMSGLGDAAKLKPLEVELKRLEDLSESIVQDFAYMRQREVRLLFIFS